MTYEEIKQMLSASLPQKSHRRHSEEELADILIACMTELYARGVPVLNIVRKKINYNRDRK